MEYTYKTPNNLSKYVDDFHISVKKEFETALTNIYTSEINKYSDIIEHIVKLPFVQAIVDENIRLKEDISRLRGISRNTENHVDNKQVVLEISDKPVQQSYQNMDDVVLEHHDSDEDDSEDEDSDDADSEDEDISHDDNIDKSPCVESNNNTHPTFSKPNIEETRKVEEHVEQPTDDEPAEEDQCVDDEDDEEEAQEDQCVDDEDDEEEADDEEMVDDDEEEQEVTELEIDGKTYYCDGEENGNIYEDDDGDVGNIVGELKDGEAIFH